MYFVIENDLISGELCIVRHDMNLKTALAKLVDSLQAKQVELKEGENAETILKSKDAGEYYIVDGSLVSIYQVTVDTVGSYIPYYSYEIPVVKPTKKFTVVPYRSDTIRFTPSRFIFRNHKRR